MSIVEQLILILGYCALHTINIKRHKYLRRKLPAKIRMQVMLSFITVGARTGAENTRAKWKKYLHKVNKVQIAAAVFVFLCCVTFISE